ncbi:WGR domain-containing protein [Methylomicrobium sp. RS1]|nr:WGR domain-containing protein [Methylomicrobium sp. RS1]
MQDGTVVNLVLAKLRTSGFRPFLEAKDASRNIHRAYSIAYGQDLFGNWVVETTYGRIGGKGRTLVTIVNNEYEALKYVQKALKRKQYAPKRIGVGYEVRATS